MQTVCAGSETVKGVDVSNYQDVIDWVQAFKAGYEFAFIKASEGYSPDKTSSAHKAGAKAAGLIIGSYHYFHAEKDPILQAQTLLAASVRGPGDLPYVMDWEVTGGTLPGEDISCALKFLNEIESKTGIVPIIYTGPYFFESLGAQTQAFKKYPLWIAHYGVPCPDVPAPWDTWTFWQNGSSLQLPGTRGYIDSNLFNGNIEQLKKLV